MEILGGNMKEDPVGRFRNDDQADYAKPCHPPLSSEDLAWAAELIRGAKTKQA